MKITYGKGTSGYGPGVDIELTGEEVAIAIDAWLVGQGVHVEGPRTTTVNGELCHHGRVYVDPAGKVITPSGVSMSGRGENH